MVFSAPTRADPAGASVGRLGITVSRRVGNAVVRNRLKRRVREWYRRERSALASGLDLVVIARPAAAKLDSAATSAQLTALLGARS